MSTSSNCIIHYTNDIQNLYSILKNGFFPSYCKEKISLKSDFKTFAVPIVSFCDIPLSQVKDHMLKYGEYGIGLTIEWASNLGLNPVQYLEKSSTLNQGISNIMNFLHNDWHEIIDDDDDFEKFYDETYRGAVCVLQSIKNYSNELIRNNINLGEYKFYDEREWRYSPIISINDVDEYPDIYYEDDFKELEKKFPQKPPARRSVRMSRRSLKLRRIYLKVCNFYFCNQLQRRSLKLQYNTSEVANFA